MSDYTARYWRHMQEYAEPCDSLQEAVSYLANGWERSDLAEIDIIGPDGTVVLEGDELQRQMMAALDRRDDEGAKA